MIYYLKGMSHTGNTSSYAVTVHVFLTHTVPHKTQPKTNLSYTCRKKDGIKQGDSESNLVCVWVNLLTFDQP